MRKLYLLLFFVLCGTVLFSQNLLTSRQSSPNTFIYKLTNEQARVLYNDVYALNDTYLTNLFAFFPTDSGYKKSLPVGHYVYIKSVGGDMKCDLSSVNNLEMKILNNHRDMMVVFADQEGKERGDVEVKLGKKSVAFDSRTKTYRLKKSNRKGLLSAVHAGHMNVFVIDKRYRNSLVKRAGNRVLHTFPINHLVLSPILYIKNSVVSLFTYDHLRPPGFYNRIRRIFLPKNYTGYIAFNKPQYKPGDTVRMKAFVVSAKGRAYDKPLRVLLSRQYSGKPKVLTTLEAFRKGAYKYEFKLTDSLKMLLDTDYDIWLMNRKGRTLLSSTFRYEDYELKQNTYTVRKENKMNGKAPVLFVKGTDSNDMPLYDVRVEVLLKPKSITKYYDAKVFVPDTLWFYQTRLEAVGETSIVLPDSLLPAVAMDYEAEVTFLNSENERTVRKVTLTYDRKVFPVYMEVKDDSLMVTAIGELIEGEVITLEASGVDEDFGERTITLPHRERVNPLAEGYRVRYQKQWHYISLDEDDDNLRILANRTRDSLVVATENPRGIPFRYFIFRNQVLVDEGHTENLAVKRKARANDNYTVSVQYVWAGEAKTRDYTMPFNKKVLNITVDHAALVYPGQKTNFTVTVNDAAGKPVEHADVTAYAITRKFASADVPAVPRLEKQPQKRKIFNEFTLNEDTETNLSRQLNYDYWKKTLGIDSITYYKFIFPAGGYYEYRKPAEMAQIAPFVVSNGAVMMVNIIYIDGQPVYYRDTGSMEPYSFAVAPGVHTIALRLFNELVTINNVKIDSAQKLIFSVDKWKLPANCTLTHLDSKLTEAELANLSRYFVLVAQPVRGERSYLQLGDRFYLHGGKTDHYGNRELTGPFYPGKLTYFQRGGYVETVNYEPFQRYAFERGLIRQKDANIRNYLSGFLGFRFYDRPPLADQVLTFRSIESNWKMLDESATVSFKRFPESALLVENAGRLTLSGIPEPVRRLIPRVTFIVNVDHPEEYYVVPGMIRDEKFNPGSYEVVVVFENGSYVKGDSIAVKTGGLNYYNLNGNTLNKPDTLSMRILNMIKNWKNEYVYHQQTRERELQQVREIYYQQADASMSFDHVVTGRVIAAEDGMGLPGVNVVVKGYRVGTVTDAEGYYSLSCPGNAVLSISFIGFKTEEYEVDYHATVDVQLTMDVQQLQEVVVTGFGIQSRRDMTGSVSQVLSGRVAGVEVKRYGETGLADSVSVIIRGVSTEGGNDPLVVLDGVVIDMITIDKSKVTAIELLKGDAATAIYGARGANGVLLLSTKPGATKAYLKEMSKSMMIAGPEEVPGNALRKNFRDYAFWKPDLVTDENGKAVFEATFPDDITGWDAFVLGMSTRKRSGQTSSTIQSYKPLTAQIAQPHFLIEGDNAMAIGKITSYSQEEVRLERSIKVNDEVVKTGVLGVTNSAVDSIRLTSNGKDSIAVEYMVTFNKYRDGELRKIPVYKKGTLVAKGDFFTLDRDTTFTIGTELSGDVKLYAQADLLDVLLDEVQYLKNYSYECNEQLASRLRALLLEEQIKKYRGEKITDRRALEKVIRKLVSHQNKDGSWAWWNTGEGEPWIAVHVAGSLMLAEKNGFKIPYDREQLFNYVVSTLTTRSPQEKLNTLLFLAEHKQTVSTTDITDSLMKSKSASVYEKLVALRLKQLQGQAADWALLVPLRSQTIKGNYYWGEERNTITDNSVLTTLLAYKILAKENPSSSELIRIRNYFLEQRKKSWRNTYESSIILETLLPDLLAQKGGNQKATLQLSGSVNKTVDTFPFEMTAKDLMTLTVSKSGQSPVYFTHYTESWDAAPKRSTKDFVVDTKFDAKTNTLSSGKPVKLEITLEVLRDAEYVMIEVPVPAGCSYTEKRQSRSNGEVHREYYNHKTNIYCKQLKKGIYHYSIELVPRYAGKYTLNPAVAECMYFPVLNGREGMKEVVVKF